MKRSELIEKLMEDPTGDPEVSVFDGDNGVTLDLLCVEDERPETGKDSITLWTE